MAKNPAILFYTADFLTATMLWTNEQIGSYMKLLCIQHQQGHLPYKVIENITGGDEEIISKFVQDENGLYYNERMQEEIDKRNSYSESRSINRKKKENISSSYGKDMKNICYSYEKHMENENNRKNNNINIDNITIDIIKDYCINNNINIDINKFFNYYSKTNWTINGELIKDWRTVLKAWAKRERPKNDVFIRNSSFDVDEMMRENLKRSGYGDDDIEAIVPR